MSLISRTLIPMMGRRSAKRFEAATLDPMREQQRRLAAIIERNRSTAYGREHGFASIQTVAQWRRQVPVVDYEDLRPWVDRMARGEESVLTAEVPILFARTSGTAGEPKLIPVTRTCRQDHAEQIRTWFFHAWSDHPSIWSGKLLSLVSPAVEGYTDAGIPYGSASGHTYRSLPAVARRAYAIPYDVFEIRDYEAQYYTIMRIGLAEDVRFLGTANPSSILRLCEMADRHADRLLADLSDGTLSRDLDVPDRVRGLIQPALRPMPARARRLEEARHRRRGRLLPADYWPDLALIGCWTGGTVGGHVHRFGQWFDPDGSCGVAVRDWGWLSSEARGSIPISDDRRGGVLSVGSSFYEFVPAEDLEADPEGRTRWRFRSADELEIGDEYYAFLTTTGGLYRYDINDVIAVVEKHNGAPVIEFRRKGRGVTSLTGEKVSSTQVVRAFEAAARDLAIPIDHFKAEADADAGRYVFRVEARDGIPTAARVPFLRALDDELGRLNLEYFAKRQSSRLKAPQLHVMRAGWYDLEKKRLIEGGQRLFQAKTVVLSQAIAAELSSVDAIVSLEDGGNSPTG
jgi:GH3 auxin-responsive promoter